MPERLDWARVATTRGDIELSWSSRDALLEELRSSKAESSKIVAAFKGVGASRALELDPADEQEVVDAIDEWMRRVQADGLPAGIWVLRNGLIDDIADRVGRPDPGFFTG